MLRELRFWAEHAAVAGAVGVGPLPRGAVAAGPALGGVVVADGGGRVRVAGQAGAGQPDAGRLGIPARQNRSIMPMPVDLSRSPTPAAVPSHGQTAD